MADVRMIRISIRSMYQIQKLRVQNGNRIAAAFRFKLGLEPSQSEDSDIEAEKLLKQLRSEYARITDGVKRITKKWICDSTLITSKSELALIESYNLQLETEKLHKKLIIDELKKEKIWTEYLVNVRGCGELMAGVIISEIDIHKCNSISALNKFIGLDVVLVTDSDTGEIIGEGRCRKKHHLVAKQYVDSKGDTVNTVGITFNPLLKTKMIGVLGSSFIKLGGPYREVYDGIKFRYQNMPAHANKTKGHIHNMAVRAMIKEFLADLWHCWRILEGLPVRVPYAEEKLGIKHSRPRNQYVLDFEERMKEQGIPINYIKPVCVQ